MLTNILKPTFKSSMEAVQWRDQYTKWLADVDHYERTAEEVTSSVKIAVVIENVPSDLQTHLQVNETAYENDFEKLHKMVTSYLDARRSFGPTPMDVNFLGEEKGKKRDKHNWEQEGWQQGG